MQAIGAGTLNQAIKVIASGLLTSKIQFLNGWEFLKHTFNVIWVTLKFL